MRKRRYLLPRLANIRQRLIVLLKVVEMQQLSQSPVWRDALLSTALYVCLGCAVPVLGARHQRREAQEIAESLKAHDAHTTATRQTLTLTVGLGGVGRADTAATGSILDASID